MNEAQDPLVLALTGQLPFVLMAAAIFSWPLSLFLLRLYRRAVLKSMNTWATPPQMAASPGYEPRGSTRVPATSLLVQFVEPAALPLLHGNAAALSRQAGARPWAAAAVYGVAGVLFALVMGVSFLLSAKMEILPGRLLILIAVFAWPVVLTINILAASTLRARLITLSAYISIFAAFMAFGQARSPDSSVGQMIQLWAVSNMPPTVLMLLVLNRRVRAVGPLVMILLVAAFLGAVASLAVAGSNTSLLHTISDFTFSLGLGPTGSFFSVAIVGFALLAILGWMAMAWVRWRYEAKVITDQSLPLDAMWLLFGIVSSIGLVFEGAVWILSGLVAFVVYKVAVRKGFKLLLQRQVESSPRLLLLRVFALDKRSERLFDVVTRHWRYLGPVQLIAGPDLATTTIEPHEFMGFLSRKIARMFIGSSDDLERKMAELVTQQDFDGRYRVNDFFCHDDTWEMALSRLVRKSDAVLMDLRSFSRERKGCIRELNELINMVPLERVLLVTDNTTDQQFLEQTLHQAWQERRHDTPNSTGADITCRILRLHKDNNDEFARIPSWLCAAAMHQGVTA